MTYRNHPASSRQAIWEALQGSRDFEVLISRGETILYAADHLAPMETTLDLCFKMYEAQNATLMEFRINTLQPQER